ncbi:hypothetical protein ONQ60_27540, partial [Salmonella enterica subsp. enterica serovar Virginia]|nr:hypothetical protein [Salmonella enterica subsp. enterica serovar Virginia]
HTIHNPVVKGNETQHEGVTPAAAETQASAPEQKPEPVKANVPNNSSAVVVCCPASVRPGVHRGRW